MSSTLSAAPGSDARRRVRNYLLDPALQLRFATYVVAVVAALAIALGWMLWAAYRETSRIVVLADPQAGDAIGAMLAHEDRIRITWLGASVVALIVVLLAFALVVTHRVAGPAHALAATCRRIAGGGLPAPRTLRRHDLLTGLAGEVAAMVEALREREERDRELLARAALAVRQGGSADPELAATLEQVVEEKRRRLES